MKNVRLSPRFIIGKSEANGLTGFSAGDIFEKDGEIFRLCCGGGGWTLRRTIKADGYRTDYSAPPLDGWVDMPSAVSVAEKLNEAASHG